jgi:ribosomal protein S27AE
MVNKATVNYEDTLKLPIEKVYEVSVQWLQGQHKAKVGKKSRAPNFIIAKQGTMMTSSGFDPNWKKQIRMNLFEVDGDKTLIQIEATILSRNIRTKHIEKLKQAWWNGLFSNLFSLLVKMEGGRKEKAPKLEPTYKPEEVVELKAKFCPSCGKKLEEKITICPSCGVEVD